MNVYEEMPVIMCVRVCYCLCMDVRMYQCECVNVCVCVRVCILRLLEKSDFSDLI